MVPITPITIPAAATALGIAKIPVPSELFSKCINAPENLKPGIHTTTTKPLKILRIGVFHISVFVRTVFFFGDSVNTTDRNFVLMIGKFSSGIFGNKKSNFLKNYLRRTEIINSEC